MTILTGWKAIAGYLNCGVRTAQRWETNGLPIHRLKVKGTVISFTEELDAWAEASPVKVLDEVAELRSKIRALEKEIVLLKRQISSLAPGSLISR